MTSAYPDIDTEIVSDYKGEALHRVLRCCYDNLSGEIVLPCTVIMDYITPANSIEELVFLSRSDISRSNKANWSFLSCCVRRRNSTPDLVLGLDHL